MTDEEKKAINNMKFFARVHQDMTVVTANEMEIVLNLIEKQSKEIEELKEKFSDEKIKNASIVKITTSGKTKRVNLFQIQNEIVQEINQKWKDKIKAKIEEYEKALNILLQKDEWIEPSDTIIRNKFIHYIEFGQSLLEKE